MMELAKTLYPGGKQYGDSWRVSSDELGQGAYFEEDLTIYASGAIKDNGPEDKNGDRTGLRILWLIRRDLRIVKGELKRLKDRELALGHMTRMSASTRHR